MKPNNSELNPPINPPINSPINSPKIFSQETIFCDFIPVAFQIGVLLMSRLSIPL
jgi:hypothetical protein